MYKSLFDLLIKKIRYEIQILFVLTFSILIATSKNDDDDDDEKTSTHI